MLIFLIVLELCLGQQKGTDGRPDKGATIFVPFGDHKKEHSS
jgi:hypothetical protein